MHCAVQRTNIGTGEKLRESCEKLLEAYRLRRNVSLTKPKVMSQSSTPYLVGATCLDKNLRATATYANAKTTAIAAMTFGLLSSLI